MSALSPIEHNLELEELDLDIYRSARELWRPKNARGIFGGAVIGQALNAASRTVPDGYFIHSLHSYFVLRGDESRPVVYHVERVRDGKSYITRTVQARQRNRAIFTMTCSFQKSESSALRHQAIMPHALPDPESLPADPREAQEVSPTESRIIPRDTQGESASERKVAFWVRAKGTIQGAWHAHAMAMGYFTDSWFLSTSLRVNGHTPLDAAMMASLDHTIYFHKPCKADEWLYFEMESPWTGNGRGFNIGRIFTRQGELVAECMQEGLIRLKKQRDEKL